MTARRKACMSQYPDNRTVPSRNLLQKLKGCSLFRRLGGPNPTMSCSQSPGHKISYFLAPRASIPSLNLTVVPRKILENTCKLPQNSTNPLSRPRSLPPTSANTERPRASADCWLLQGAFFSFPAMEKVVCRKKRQQRDGQAQKEGERLQP